MDFWSGQNIIGWMVSEKLDGVFARNREHGLFSKEWRIIDAPKRLINGAGFCDGEIWHKEGLQRVQGCLSWSKQDPRWNGVSFVPHHSIRSVLVTEISAAMRFYEDVLSRGGEGVVFTSPNGEMLKHKPLKDEEAVVCGYNEVNGRIKSLVVRMGEIEFSLSSGLSNKDKEAPPKIGSVVTYSYFGHTNSGIPRSPRFLRIRIDD